MTLCLWIVLALLKRIEVSKYYNQILYIFGNEKIQMLINFMNFQWITIYQSSPQSHEI